MPARDFNCKVRNNTRLSSNFSVNAISRWDTENSGKLSADQRALTFLDIFVRGDKGEPVLI